MGYSPWGHKESDMTEQLTLFFFFFFYYFKLTVETYCSENKILSQLLLADRHLLTQEL